MVNEREKGPDLAHLAEFVRKEIEKSRIEKDEDRENEFEAILNLVEKQAKGIGLAELVKSVKREMAGIEEDQSKTFKVDAIELELNVAITYSETAGTKIEILGLEQSAERANPQKVKLSLTPSRDVYGKFA